MTTIADINRLEAIHDLPCICCELRMLTQPWPTEAHHIISKGYRKHSGGHQATIPLDSWHHRGLCLDGLTTSEMTDIYGPSLAVSKREFVRVFGSEKDLLDQTNSLLTP